MIGLLCAQGRQVGGVVVPDNKQTMGINDRVQLAEAEGLLRAEIRQYHMRNGVTLLDPASTFIDEEVVIGQDTIIHPFTLLGAGTRIGVDCVVGPSCQLFAAVLEDEVEVCSSRVEHSVVRRGAKVGPFSRLRAGCDIGTEAVIGNYCRVEKHPRGRTQPGASRRLPG